MTCPEFQNSLGRYVDGELSKEAAQQLEAHLRICNVCVIEYNKLQRYLKRVKAIPPTFEVPAQIKLQIHNSISDGFNQEVEAEPVSSSKKLTEEKKSKVKTKEKPVVKNPGKIKFRFVLMLIFGIVVFGIYIVKRLLHN